MPNAPVRFLSRDELLQLCAYEGFHPPQVEFSVNDVPDYLRNVIPYAEIWGHDFEEARTMVRDNTPPGVCHHIARLQSETDLADRLSAWLAGPAADVFPFSPAYIAFSCLNQTLSAMD